MIQLTTPQKKINIAVAILMANLVVTLYTAVLNTTILQTVPKKISMDLSIADPITQRPMIITIPVAQLVDEVLARLRIRTVHLSLHLLLHPETTMRLATLLSTILKKAMKFLKLNVTEIMDLEGTMEVNSLSETEESCQVLNIFDFRNQICSCFTWSKQQDGATSSTTAATWPTGTRISANNFVAVQLVSLTINQIPFLAIAQSFNDSNLNFSNNRYF